MADRMRKALETKGFSVTEAALYFRVGRNTVSNWIHGKTKPPYSVVREWAEWCSVPVMWLETGEPGSTSGPGLTLLPHLDSNQEHFDYQFHAA